MKLEDIPVRIHSAMVKDFPKFTDESLIPENRYYCYTPIETNLKEKYKIKLCPYWRYAEDKEEQESGYCLFLGEGDWEDEHFSLLFDQVKECGINEDTEFYELD